MSHLPPRPGGWSQVATRQRHLAGDHAQCRPSSCLAARDGQAPTAELAPTALAGCAVCGAVIEHVTTGPDAPWWRHLGSIGGPPHGAHPTIRTVDPDRDPEGGEA